MTQLEPIAANLWNRMVHLFQPKLKGGLPLGNLVIEGRLTKKPYFIPQVKRTEHIDVLGRTGSGKTSLLKSMCLSDIRAGRGFLFFDHHGDTIPFLLSVLAEEEVRTGVGLASRVVVIEPGNPNWAVGINPLAVGGEEHRFVQTVAIANILKERWGLEHFGARTEEVLRNALYVLATNSLTLLELPALLSRDIFRAQCLRGVSNYEVKEYFESRYEPMSDGMKGMVRDPILNKVSEFISDPHFKFILGQVEPSFTFDAALETDQVVLVDLNKGLLGGHSATLGTLILSQLRPAIFRRSSRKLYTVYADECQNLLTSDTDFDTYLAEARKFSVSFVTANQFLDQLPNRMRAAVQAVGTHVAFQVSSQDCQQMANTLGGNKQLAELLKNLPKRQFVVKSGHYPWQRAEAANVEPATADFSDLLQRSRTLHARPRADVEREIEARRPKNMRKEEALDAWE